MLEPISYALKGQWALYVPRTSMDTAQTPDPSLSQNRLSLLLMHRNMNARADASLTSPKMPVRNKEEDTEVKPADWKIMGESTTLSAMQLLLTDLLLTIIERVQADHVLCNHQADTDSQSIADTLPRNLFQKALMHVLCSRIHINTPFD